MKIQKTTVEPSEITIKAMLNLLSEGKRSIEKAAYIMAALVDKDPQIYAKIIKEDPSVPLQCLVSLEKVGRGTLYPELLFDSSPAARKLLLLPYSQQKEAYEKPIKVVSVRGGKKVELEKTVQSLTPSEANIVFGDSQIRTTAEQVKVIDQMQLVSHQSKPAQRYTIMPNGNLVIHFAHTEFTPGQLEDITARAKANAIKSLRT